MGTAFVCPDWYGMGEEDLGMVWKWVGALQSCIRFFLADGLP